MALDRRLTRRGICTLATLVFLVLLYWGGAQPFAVGLFPHPYDIAAHLAAFSVLAVLLWGALGGRWLWLAVAGTALVGALDEIHQMRLPERDPGVMDGLMDLTAAVVTVGVLVGRGW